MPTEVKPLFHPVAVREAMTGFALTTAAVAAREKVRAWVTELDPKKPSAKKETELLPGFVEDVFAGALSYTRPPTDPYTLTATATNVFSPSRIGTVVVRLQLRLASLNMMLRND